MKLIDQILALIVLVMLIGVAGSAAYLAFEYVAALLMQLEPQVATIAGVSWVVVLAASWMITRVIRSEKPVNQTAALREEKTASYQLFVDYWENLLGQEPVRSGPLSAELADKLKVLERLLALYGGASVVKAHTALRELAYDKGAQHPAVRTRFGEALLVIRKDLGTDTPRNFGIEMERLLVPARGAGSDAGVYGDTGTPQMPSPTA